MNKSTLFKYLVQDMPDITNGFGAHLRNVTEPSSLHWHNYFEIELITEGNGEQLLNGKKTELKRGSVSVMRLTDYHQVIPIKSMKLTNISFEEKLLPEEILNTLTSLGETLYFNVEEEGFSVLEQIGLLCAKECSALPPDKKYIKNMLESFFIQLFRSISLKGRAVLPSPPKLSPIHRAVFYLHMHFRENPTLSEIAKTVHYNPSHFSSAFRKEMGITYCDYLTYLKINYAKELLRDTELKISDICFESGFSSYASFHRAFKRHTSLTPNEFRSSY